MILRSAVVGTLMVLSACAPTKTTETSGTEGNIFPKFTIRTDTSHYVAYTEGDRVAARVITILHNGGSRPVAFGICGRSGEARVLLERWMSNGWQVVWSQICDLSPAEPLTIAPGETVVDTVSIYGFTSPNTLPSWGGDWLPGTYRLVYLAEVDTEDHGRKVQNPGQRSSMFGLRAP